jgi:hypothetical protein
LKFVVYTLELVQDYRATVDARIENRPMTQRVQILDILNRNKVVTHGMLFDNCHVWNMEPIKALRHVVAKMRQHGKTREELFRSLREWKERACNSFAFCSFFLCMLPV